MRTLGRAVPPTPGGTAQEEKFQDADHSRCEHNADDRTFTSPFGPES